MASKPGDLPGGSAGSWGTGDVDSKLPRVFILRRMQPLDGDTARVLVGVADQCCSHHPSVVLMFGLIGVYNTPPN